MEKDYSHPAAELSKYTLFKSKISDNAKPRVLIRIQAAAYNQISSVAVGLSPRKSAVSQYLPRGHEAPFAHAELLGHFALDKNRIRALLD